MEREGGMGIERGGLLVRHAGREDGLWVARTHLEKREPDMAAVMAERGWSREEFMAKVAPFEVLESEGNILVTTGINLMLDLLIGAGGTVFSNANAHIGVGDSTTAAAQGQTDLQAATNKLRKAMVATYPQRGTRDVTFRSDFGDSDANFAWEEWGTFNASSAGTMLHRKVENKGTKSSGTWTFTIVVSIS
jgi:hypothetical protein